LPLPRSFRNVSCSLSVRLEKAATDVRTRGDANLALAAFWRVAQEPYKVKECLFLALDTYLKEGSWKKAEALSKRLRKEYPDELSPVLRELEKRSRQLAFDDTLELLKIARETEQNEDIVRAVREGCAKAVVPDSALSGLLGVLKDSGFSDLGKEIAADAGMKKMARVKRLFSFRRKLPGKVQVLPEEVVLEPVMETQNEPDDGVFMRRGPVIAPLSARDPGDNLSPSSFGDAWTVVKGTMKLAKSEKKTDG